MNFNFLRVAMRIIHLIVIDWMSFRISFEIILNFLTHFFVIQLNLIDSTIFHNTFIKK